MTTPQRDLARIAQAAIDANSYLTLATADRTGLPWPSPVWYAHAGYREFFWVSAPGTRHSRNLAERPEAGIVIFDSHVPAGTAQAVYLTVTAAEATADELIRGIKVFSARSQAKVGKPWTPDDVRAPSALRLYRASVSGLWVVDGFDQRLRVDLENLAEPVHLPAGWRKFQPGPADRGECLYCGAVTTQVIVLNGGSSSGKSGIARCLQAVLPDPWLAVGDDMLIQAMPASMQASDTGIEFAADGGVSVGPEFRRLEAAWMDGIAAIARAGARVILDEIFLGGAVSQQRWQKALTGLDVLWVAVRCDSAIAAGRELARGDRVRRMAVSQAEVVHQGVVYDLEVDTTHTESLACARMIAARAG